MQRALKTYRASGVSNQLVSLASREHFFDRIVKKL